MPAILSAIIFFLFAGIVSNPFNQGPGDKLIPEIGKGGSFDCLQDDASSGTPTLFKIPKATKDNVNFVNTPPCFESSDPAIVNAPDYNCGTNPWDGQPYPDPVANYVPAAPKVVITDVWPHADTTRLAKQILPRNGEPNYDLSFDEGDFRNQIYRATCNDWCLFKPPNRSPALPYGGTFFCDFVFFYLGQNQNGAIGERKWSEKNGELYPDDTNCNDETKENCPLFDILVRENAPIPDYAGGAAPGSDVTPLRCALKNTTPTPNQTSFNQPLTSFIASLWPETAQAQTETFINLTGSHPARGAWIFSAKKVTFSRKILDETGGREKIPEPPPIIFRGKEYEAFFNLISSLDKDKGILFLAETGLVDKADQERQNNNLDFPVPYLEFLRSPDTHPGGETLQLGTFPVATGKGWWELFPEESKPAIYLYPEQPIALNVKLQTKGKLTVSDPPYDPNTGWNIIAYPNGTLREYASYKSYKTYPYLYYEAILDRVKIEPVGFLVPGYELKNWFSSTLLKLGLNASETADFIQYWMGRLDPSQDYYFIHFLSEEQIEQLEPLKLSPLNTPTNFSNAQNTPNTLTPNTSIRIRPYFKPLSVQEANQLAITPQTLPTPPKRKGFVLVEWGGILAERVFSP